MVANRMTPTPPIVVGRLRAQLVRNSTHPVPVVRSIATIIVRIMILIHKEDGGNRPPPRASIHYMS